MPQRRQSIQLCNGQSGFRTLLAAEIRVLSKADGLVEYVASDETIDSYKEIVRADGWRFDQFQKNSPFVDTHDYSTIGKLLGNVVDWRVDKQKRELIETVRWAKDVEKNTLAQLGWEMLVAGFGPKAVSVGFMPVICVSKWDNDPKPWLAQLDALDIGAEDGVRAIYIQQQQIELSACILGANPNALQMARKAFEAGVLNKREFQFLESRRTAPQFQIPFESQTPTSKNMKNNFSSGLARIARRFDKSDAGLNNLHRAQRNGSDSELGFALGSVRLASQLESRAALRDPIQRILANPERRLFLNALARKIMNANLNDEQAQYLKSLDELTSPGTNLIADDFADEIYDLLAQNGAWATLGVKQIFSKKAKFAITTAYPNAVFVLQGVTLNDDSAFAGTSVLADTATVACLVKCSLQSLEDSEVDLSANLLENFSGGINNRLDTGVFIGNGAVDANNGGMTGIFTDTTIGTVNAGAGHTDLRLCDRDDFLAVVGAVSANALQRPCRWWVRGLVEQGSLISFNIAVKNSSRMDLRVLTKSVDHYRQHHGKKSLILEWPEIFHLVLPDKKPFVRGVEIRRGLNCDRGHVENMIAAGLLVMAKNSRPGPNGSPIITRSSFEQFLIGRLQ